MNSKRTEEFLVSGSVELLVTPERETSGQVLALRSHHGNQAGFSLIEIIIVLGILGTLIALLLGGLGGAQDSAKIKETGVKAGQIQSQLLRYQADLNKMPTTADGLNALTNNTSGSAKWTGPYLQEEDTKDAWGIPFNFEMSAKGAQLRSPGKDGQDGTADDLVYVNGRLVEQEGAAAGENK